MNKNKIYAFTIIFTPLWILNVHGTDWGLPGWNFPAPYCNKMMGPDAYSNQHTDSVQLKNGQTIEDVCRCSGKIYEWVCSQGDLNCRCPNYTGWLYAIKNGGSLIANYGLDQNNIYQNPICVDIINSIGGNNGTFPPAPDFSTFVYRFENLNGRCDVFQQRTGNEFKDAFCDFVKQDIQNDSSFYQASPSSAYGRSQYATYCGTQLP